jgi:hypothetical protein
MSLTAIKNCRPTGPSCTLVKDEIAQVEFSCSGKQEPRYWSVI